MRRIRATLMATAALSGCADDGRPSPACGIAALTGPLVALEGFARGDGLSEAPTTTPPRLPARFVAGPLVSSLVSRGDSGLIAAIDAPTPEGNRPGFGVMLTDRDGTAIGILVYDGTAVRGAVQLGTLQVGDSTLPLLGVRVTPSTIEDARCPLFATPSP